MGAVHKRIIAKQAALAAAYGMGSSQMVRQGLAGAGAQFWSDGLSALAAADQVWADAFGEVLGVGSNFYIKADPARKTWLENHYRELATHDTPKGRKAAKVVTHVVKWQLAPQPQVVAFDMEANGLGFDFKTGLQHDHAADAVAQQMAIYRKIFRAPEP